MNRIALVVAMVLPYSLVATASLASAAPYCSPPLVYSAAPQHVGPSLLLLSDCGATKKTLATGLGLDSTLSPDGSQVATTFGGVANDAQNSLFQVHVRSLDGSSDQVVTPNLESVSPTWAPDGRQLAYATSTMPGLTTRHIYINTPNGSAAHQLTNDSVGSDSNPAWSPDGQHIAFIRYDTNNFSLSLRAVDSTGLNQKLLYTAPVGVGIESPAWTPDSNYIVFASVGSSGSTSRFLDVIALSGGAVGQLPTVPGGASQPTISQDWSLSYIGFPGGPHIVVQPIMDPSNALVFKYEDGLGRPEFRPQESVKPPPTGFPPVGTSPPTPQSRDMTPPIVNNVAPTAVNIGDPLLMRTFQITASDEAGGSGLDHLDYVWSQGPIAPENALVRHVGAAATIPISFADASPDEQWNLFIRAVDKAGNVGAWFKYSTRTPHRPILVALGDSIVSGHHLAGTDHATVCDDPSYSYASDVALRLQQTLPAQWRSPAGPFDGNGSDGYYNFAHSGFSTGEMLNGGANACKKTKAASVRQAAQILNQHRGSWNQVIISAGIDDTNWGSFFTGPIAAAVAGKRLFGISFIPTTCSVMIRATWTGYSPAVDRSITTNVRTIVRKLEDKTTGDPTARINWSGYYDISGTGPLDGACHTGVVAALNQLSNTVRAGLSSDVHWVDPNSVMDRRADLMQPFFDVLAYARKDLLVGWPHPVSPAGTNAIASLYEPVPATSASP